MGRGLSVTTKKKAALFAFNGDPVCFIHVLLNALDLSAKAWQVQIVIEGASTSLVPILARGDGALHKLYKQAKEKNLIGGVCRACAKKNGALDAAKREGLTLLDDMSGHPSMASYMEKGFEIITF
jgi:hypothetical protein